MKCEFVQLMSIVFFSLLLSACTGKDDAKALYGAPTTMAKNESPIDTVCRIQAEFKELPKPLMKSMNYEYPWTSWNFGAAPVDHDGYHTVQLTEVGLEFLSKHSRLELVVSLTPLFAEAGIGGEAATLLAGIPAGDKSVQRGKTAALASALGETYYRQPKRPGDWYKKAEQYYSRVKGLYSIFNKTESIHAVRPENIDETLEAKIIEELNKYGAAPYKIFNERPYMPQPHSIESIREWVAKNDPPKLNESALKFTDTDDVKFSALALFPFLPSPAQSGLNRDQILMMYLLGIEDKYWPAMMNLTSGQQEIIQLRNEFKKLIPKQFSDLCHKRSE